MGFRDSISQHTMQGTLYWTWLKLLLVFERWRNLDNRGPCYNRNPTRGTRDPCLHKPVRSLCKAQGTTLGLPPIGYLYACCSCPALTFGVQFPTSEGIPTKIGSSVAACGTKLVCAYQGVFPCTPRVCTLGLGCLSPLKKGICGYELKVFALSLGGTSLYETVRPQAS